MAKKAIAVLINPSEMVSVFVPEHYEAAHKTLMDMLVKGLVYTTNNTNHFVPPHRIKEITYGEE